MKREEKNLQSRRRILSAALHEFGTHPYETASLNTICQEGGVSKGIIYHYFKDKDELYLLCVQECFDALAAYIKEQPLPQGDSMSALKQWLFGALPFFEGHPLYANLYAGAVLVPPRHLAAAVGLIQREYEALSRRDLTALPIKAQLRPGLDVDAAFSALCAGRDMICARLLRERLDGSPLHSFEYQGGMLADLLLRGVLKNAK